MKLDRLATLNREDIDRGLEPAALQSGKILQVSLVLGQLLFLGVVLLFHSMASPDRRPHQGVAMPLLAVSGALLLGCGLVTVLLPRLFLQPGRLARQAARLADAADPIAWAAGQQRLLQILRMGLMEAPAMVGLIALLLAAMNHELGDRPVLWLSLAPLGIFVAFGIATFPTRERVVTFITDRVLNPLKAVSLQE